MNKLLRYAVDLIFPPRCSVCGEVTLIGTEVCDSCIEELRSQFDSLSLCSRCGKPADSCVCRNLTSLSGCISVFEYRRDTVMLFEKLKHDIESPAAAQLAKLMAARFYSSNFSDLKFDCITYVPSNADKVSAKGFDHARRLAEQLSKHINIPCFAPPIEQNSDYRTQHSLNRLERIENANLGYTASDAKGIVGRVLLVDDIITTGATLERCAQLLISCGASSVFCITAASTLIRPDDDSDNR